MCRQGERKACIHIICSVDFDALALIRFDMTFDVTLRDDSSFGNSQKRLIFTFTSNV